MPKIRITLDTETHRKFKVACARDGLTMQNATVGLIRRRLRDELSPGGSEWDSPEFKEHITKEGK